MRRAFSFVDLLILAASGTLLVATLLPVLARSRGDSGQVTSANNLQTLSLALAMYAWDFGDRQPTWIPDDAGMFGDEGSATASCQAYIEAGGCPPPLILGWDNGDLPTPVWAYFLGCDGGGGSCSSWIAYMPNTFTPSNIFGAFRLLNAHMFSQYVEGRFYSEPFYAPNDTITWELAEPLFDLVAEFTVVPPYGQGKLPQIVNSSYAMSPAAMWNPAVLSYNPQTDAWFRHPDGLIDGYQSPSVSQCAYPDLKTRLIEHNWNFGQPGPVNPAFEGGYTPYFFNSGIDAAPITLFFDGHVAELPNAQVVADDQLVLKQTGGAVGLWTRDTPLGASGYYGEQSYDGTLVSHHILTAGGILGRDVLNVAPPAEGLADGAGAGAGRRGSMAGTTAAVGGGHRPTLVPPPGSGAVAAPMQ